MNKLDLQPAPLALTPASHPAGEPARWVIVLVPSIEVDLTAASHRIWELAHAMGSRVRFVGLYDDAAHESSLRRQLVAMSAMVGNTRIFTETEAIFGTDWVEVLRSRWHAGDIVVCFAGQRAGRQGRSLSDVLQSDLNVPVYILSGIHQQKSARPNWLAHVTAWSGSLGIIFGFFLLQARIGHLAKDGTQFVLLLSIPVEAWMLWAWNSLFGS